MYSAELNVPQNHVYLFKPHFAELLSMNDILPYFATREYGIIPHHEGLL